MKRRFLTLAIGALFLALNACAPGDAGEGAEAAEDMAAAESMGGEDAADMAVSSLQSEWLADLSQLREKYVGLAEAVPEEGYGWRPAEGIRSVSEVYMHVVAANIGIVSGVLGEAPPESADPTWFGPDAESITDKATVVEAVGASFDYVAGVIEGTSDERLMEAANLFGNESTVRAALMLVVTHCHEHLGQLIAYARSNDVVPPWSM